VTDENEMTSAPETPPTLDQLLERSRRLRNECDRLHAELQTLENRIAKRAGAKRPAKKTSTLE
jgi:hypothetical protein